MNYYYKTFGGNQNNYSARLECIERIINKYRNDDIDLTIAQKEYERLLLEINSNDKKTNNETKNEIDYKKIFK